MKINSEIRATALDELHGNWTSPVLATLIMLAINMTVSVLNNSTYDTINTFIITKSLIGFLLSLFVVLPLSFTYSVAFLQFIRGEKDNVIDNMFNGINNYGRVLGTALLRNIFTFLWALLFIIPGIIKHYSYGMTYYIAKDHPELSSDDCIEESMKMMDGHKLDLFVLDLSFIGWALLCILTLGIGFLWLNPYIETSHAIFYKELKAELYPETENAETEDYNSTDSINKEFEVEFEN